MSNKVSLRRFYDNDAEAIMRICNDEDVQRYLLLSLLPYTTENARQFIKYTRDSQINGGEQCFAITLDGKVIGCISYTIQSGCKSNSATIGYYIGKDYWHSGYMPKAVALIIEKVFENEGIHRIFAEIFTENTASARVLEKCGFTLEGILRKGIIKNGVEHDAKLYAFVR